MRITILANSGHGFTFTQIVADGLKRMFDGLGVESVVLCDADMFYFLSRQDAPPGDSWIWTAGRRMKRAVRLRRLMSDIGRCDVVLLVAPFPTAFRKDRFCGLEDTIRRQHPEIVIVDYSDTYLPVKGPWLQWLHDGRPEADIPLSGNFGLERYDWYMATSIASEHPLPRIDNPCSVVGVNLDDGSLYPAKKDRFIALVDFERTGYMHERRIQLQALEETDTEYIVLNGSYSVSDIRAIYRQCSMYFLAFPESFGLPICELQACGSYVFTPHSNWCSGHWIKDDPHAAGPGRLSPNFIVYNNDLDTLKAEIQRVKASHQPEQVFKTFTTHHPQFWQGNIEALRDFVDKIATGQITSQSHEEYTRYNGLAVTETATPESQQGS
jgi:hypothetical protein